VRALLHDTLTADGAVQVALLNNRDLQALYAELGVAQAGMDIRKMAEMMPIPANSIPMKG
jgi:hypothetical protein